MAPDFWFWLEDACGTDNDAFDFWMTFYELLAAGPEGPK
jgi:hypothetical protein